VLGGRFVAFHVQPRPLALRGGFVADIAGGDVARHLVLLATEHAADDG
jgi:hypothetical protein